ncbi:hypothetical protein QBC39DRAFT_375098 [Podospora conica]|nr:hypothetical protein QBC39DRAFT_375098 [Schizothecium conicum]
MDAALSSKTSLAAAITKVFTCPDEIFLDYLATLFSPNLKAVVNNEAKDFDWLKAKATELRARPKMDIVVHDLFRDGKKFAWRHVGKSTLPDGKKKRVEVFVFGELDDQGRVVRQNEMVGVFES